MPLYRRSGPELTVNATYARTQAHSDVARLADGSFVVAWIDADFSTTGGRFVRARIHAPDGTAAGGELTLVAPINGAVQPTLAALPDGGFVAAWIVPGGIVAQRFGSDGTAAGPAFSIPTGSSIGRPDLAALADGGFAIAWHDSRTAGGDTSGLGVHLRTYGAGGAELSGDVLVNASTSGNQADVAVAALAGGRYVVTWTDRGAGGAIRAQLFDPAGARIGGEFVVSHGSSVESSVTALANGNFAVAWFGSSVESGPAHHIQIFTPAGERVGAAMSTAALLGGTPAKGPVIAALADGGLALAWTANYGPTYDGSDNGVFVQVFDSNGRPSGGPMQVNSQASGDQLDPTIVGLADGSFVVSWTDLNGAGADDDQVMAQIFGPDLPVAITSNGGADSADLSVAENGVAAADVAATGGGGAIGYRIAGGADAALFTIDAASGELTFAAAPDFEAPGDADGDNAYEVIVVATDGATSDSQLISVRVVDANEAPRIVTGGDSVALTVGENGRSVITVAAADPEGTPVAYAIAGGADAARFAIDAATGVLQFVAAPDYEQPADADGNNRYEVIVEASDGEFADRLAIAIAVANVRDGVLITGTAGNDSITGTSADPALRTSQAEDTVYGGGGHDTLQGLGGDDRLFGEAGKDLLTGGAGADRLVGGAGADRFVYNSVSESSGAARDFIVDFLRSQGDRISLAAIDADTTVSGNQAFSFIGSSAFSRVAGELRYETVNGTTYVSGDVNGDGLADLLIQLGGTAPLQASDFIL